MYLHFLNMFLALINCQDMRLILWNLYFCSFLLYFCLQFTNISFKALVMLIYTEIRFKIF